MFFKHVYFVCIRSGGHPGAGTDRGRRRKFSNVSALVALYSMTLTVEDVAKGRRMLYHKLGDAERERAHLSEDNARLRSEYDSASRLLAQANEDFEIECVLSR